MHLRNVELFCEVVSCCSFSKAARARRVSQSAASQAVQLLEDRVGTVLIDRTQRPLSLTPAGAIYYDGCRRLLDSFRRIEDQVSEISDRVVGRLRVSAIYSVGLLEMAGSVGCFRDQFPDVELSLDYVHPDEVYRRVEEGEADLGIVSFPRSGGDFAAIPWQEQRMQLVVSPDHELAGRRHEQVGVLAGEPFVGFCRELKVRRQIDRWLKEEQVLVHVIHEFDNCENIKRAVEIGAGVSILPEPTVRSEIEQGTLVAVKLVGVDWCRPLGFIHRRNRPPTTAGAKFIELLKDAPHGS